MPLGVEGGPSLWAPFWLKANWCISGFLLHPWPCSRMWPADLGPYTSLAECRRFFGVDDGLWAAWVASAGDPQDDYRVMAPIPPAAMAAVSEAALLPNGDPLTGDFSTLCFLINLANSLRQQSSRVVTQNCQPAEALISVSSMDLWTRTEWLG